MEISAGGMVAIGEGPETKALLDFARPFFALYVGGMGARGKNFYNDLACQYGYEQEAKEIQDLYLGGNKRDAEAKVPLEWLEADQPRRPGVVRPGTHRGVRRGRRDQPPDRAGQRRPGRDGPPAQGMGELRAARPVGRPGQVTLRVKLLLPRSNELCSTGLGWFEPAARKRISTR